MEEYIEIDCNTTSCVYNIEGKCISIAENRYPEAKDNCNGYEQ